MEKSTSPQPVGHVAIGTKLAPSKKKKTGVQKTGPPFCDMQVVDFQEDFKMVKHQWHGRIRVKPPPRIAFPGWGAIPKGLSGTTAFAS